MNKTQLHAAMYGAATVLMQAADLMQLDEEGYEDAAAVKRYLIAESRVGDELVSQVLTAMYGEEEASDITSNTEEDEAVDLAGKILRAAAQSL